MKEQQTPWEETSEEARRRIEAAKSTYVGWSATVVGILLALLALIALLWIPIPTNW